MEKFPIPERKDFREVNKYSEVNLETLEANKTELENRYQELMDNDTDLENDIEMNANVKEISGIQNEILEIENEIARRTQNN
jgi:hypothetical protein